MVKIKKTGRRPQPRIITIGEILADFVPEGSCHCLRPGGAPSNVAVNLSRMGVKTGIISCVGSDFLGGFLLDFLRKNNVDISRVKITKKAKTGLVFVFHDKNGERDFSFYGSPSADTMLCPCHVKESYVKNAKILHYGSISMMAEKSRKAAVKAVTIAKKAGLLLSYDPNLRLNLWEGREKAAGFMIKRYFKYADIIKMSESEAEFLFNRKITMKNAGSFFSRSKLVVITAGKKGAYFVYKHHSGLARGIKTKVIDTTGAGDAFTAGLLKGVLESGGLASLDKNGLMMIIDYANRAGAAAVARKGAV